MGRCDDSIKKSYMDIEMWVGDPNRINCDLNSGPSCVVFKIKNRLGTRVTVDMDCSGLNNLVNQVQVRVAVPPTPGGGIAAWNGPWHQPLRSTATRTQETLECNYRYQYRNASQPSSLPSAYLTVDL